MSEKRKALLTPEDYKSFWKYFRAALLWGLIGIFTWLVFSAFGILGSAAGAVLGLLMAFGYSRKGVIKPFSIVSLFGAGLIYILISAYLGYVLNGYVFYIDAYMTMERPISEISLSMVLEFVNETVFSADYALYDVLLETGLGFGAFSVLFGLTTYFIWKRKKRKES